MGAGPGDPGLLTARALELIASADVILHDRLIPVAALDGARPDAELVFVGKQGGGAAVAQEYTEALMVERAQAGGIVVRLKGGDPFVFGRGGEEALTLRAAGVPYEIVPGVTAGVAAPAYAGIPVTHRGLAGAVALVTGHSRDDDEDRMDWVALAGFPGTLVLYMGVSRLPAISEALIAAGRPASEPAAIVEAGNAAGPAHAHGQPQDDRADRCGRAHPGAGDHGRGTGGGTRRAALLATATATRRAHGGRDTGAGSGQHARAPAGSAGGARGAGARDPHPHAPRPAA